MDTPTAGALAVPSGLHARVLDQLGTAICSGELAPLSVLYVDDLVEQHRVSRSVIREVLRVLTAMGMVEPRRRVGTRIRPLGDWNVLDPQVIRWRLASPDRMAQLRSITELRTAIEPQAAMLAATRATPDQASDLIAVAAKMWAAAEAGDEPEFLRLDIDFHRRVLLHCGNEMFASLQQIVAESLTGRHHYHLMPQHPERRALTLHAEVAQAIQRRDGEQAGATMALLMRQLVDELQPVWENPDDAAPRATS